MANVLVLALMVVAISAGNNRGIMMAGAQSPPSPISSSSSCGASLATSLVPCLGFLQGGANNTTPTQGCCTALASAVGSSTVCVCQLFTTTNNPLGIPINNIPQSIPINQTQALTLPGACKITTSSLNQCMSTAGAGTGAGAPVGTPVSSPPVTAASSPGPAANPSANPSAIPPATSVGVLSPSGSHGVPTASANAGSMIGFSMSNMLIVGLMNVIAARIIM